MLRFVAFKTAQDPIVRLGAQLPTAILDLRKYAAQGSFKAPAALTAAALTDMVDFIAAGDSAVAWAKSAIKDVSDSASTSAFVLDSAAVQLAAPITPRRNIMCVGKNYKDHVAEVASADKSRGMGPVGDNKVDPTSLYPKYPQFFTKATHTVVGPGANVESHPTITQWLDYEAELAVVIGKAGRDLTREQAMDHVFGFTVANDITSRDVQRKHNQWFKGKSLDTTCPLGPALVHRSSAGLDPSNLSIQMWINGQLRQDSNTGKMIFDIPEILRQLSQGMTLLPGDVILTGTPHGVGYAMDPPQVLRAGDEMRAEIQHLGSLRNTMV